MESKVGYLDERKAVISRRRLHLATLLAGGIPLMGAAAIVYIGPGALDHLMEFRILLGLFIGAGILGFLFMQRLQEKTEATLNARTNEESASL